MRTTPRLLTPSPTALRSPLSPQGGEGRKILAIPLRVLVGGPSAARPYNGPLIPNPEPQIPNP